MRISLVCAKAASVAMIVASIRHVMSWQGYFLSITTRTTATSSSKETSAHETWKNQAFLLQTTDNSSSSSIVDTTTTTTTAPSWRPLPPTSSTEYAQHFLDCDKLNSTCRYFYPIDFFQNPHDGWGYEYRQGVQREAYGHADRWLPLNYIRLFHPAKLRNVTAGLPLDEPWPPADFTYIHVRKAGGITFKYMGWKFQHTALGQGYKMMNFQTNAAIVKLAKVGIDKFVSDMQQLANSTTQFFTMVRNPVSRFLSGMGQFVARRAEHVAALNCTQPPQTAPVNVTLRCVLDALAAGHRVDEHLSWQTQEIYQPLAGINVSVAVLPLSEFGNLMQALQVQPFKMNAKKGIKKKFENPAILNDQMIQEICQLYAADVHMLRFLGHAVPECEAHVPWKT